MGERRALAISFPDYTPDRIIEPSAVRWGREGRRAGVQCGFIHTLWIWEAELALAGLRKVWPAGFPFLISASLFLMQGEVGEGLRKCFSTAFPNPKIHIKKRKDLERSPPPFWLCVSLGNKGHDESDFCCPVWMCQVPFGFLLLSLGQAGMVLIPGPGLSCFPTQDPLEYRMHHARC